ncbi:hypothetical protein LQ938_04745 [Microbacterium sp. cx-55]|uniref:hypothetical protein n=1 Tax=Microbacterium sp. cx-55 TaxID=2875948 RepID=UPI001CBBA1A3|nr:hypothetical protein [Microbacterium sp. cx-55]MBZ4488518.1 hypothetical protein [Microbacterium sp. cx-55]UGB36103.1 hypothetical protein LQ938_04745 [Microbacterium sp. cx-55]
MTTPTVSSTPILRTALVWSGVMTAALVVIGGIVGFLTAGTPGLWSALSGVLVAAIFLGITAASILIANRWFGDELYVPIFFGIVLGGWILKLVLFIVALVLLRGQSWIVPMVFLLALVVSVVASLVIDVVVMMRMRLPNVSDMRLPTDVEEGERRTPNPEAGDAASGV